MATASIKENYKTAVVAFGNSGLPLGRRSDREINDLAIIARESGDKTLIIMFEELPSLEELKKAKVESELKQIMPQRQGPVIPTNKSDEIISKDTNASGSKNSQAGNRRQQEDTRY